MRYGLLLIVACAAGCSGRVDIEVGSKSFTESVILGELATQIALDTGLRADHRQQLGGTQVVWQALLDGEIDVYPEYTGTIAQELLGNKDLRDDESMRLELGKRGIRMSRPLGFNDTYAIGMNEETAARLNVKKISDLRAHPELKFGFTNEFMERADGWPGLRDCYRLPQQDVRGLDHSLAYPALKGGAIQATDFYSTDAEIRQLQPRILEDDLSYFPTYNAVFLYRADLENRQPALVAALLQLEGKISANDMIQMNALATIEKQAEGDVAAGFLTKKLGVHSQRQSPSSYRQLLQRTGEHLFLVTVSLLFGIAVALPLGIASAYFRTTGQIILGIVGIIQTIPSLALLVFMIPLLMFLTSLVPQLRQAGFRAIGAPPALIALFLYSLLPIVRNTYTGLKDIPGHIRESAVALGLPPWSRLRLIELPLAARSILAGIKIAAVITVGYATLGGLIGAGGFGEPIMTGLRRFDLGIIMWQGAIPAAVMALVVQGLFELAERFLVPKGLRLKSEV